MADELKSHLSIDGYVTGVKFRSPLNVIREPAPQRADRGAHGARLLKQIEELGGDIEDLEDLRQQLGLPLRRGIRIAIEFRPRNSFDYGSVEWAKDGIQLLTVIPQDDHDVVVLHVPDGKLSAFVKRIQEYIHENNKKGDKPKNAPLVNAIENIRRAAFSELWTDAAAPPEDNENHWFQVWLRHTAGKPEAVVAEFKAEAGKVGIEVTPGYVPFPGRLVIAAYGNRLAFQQAVDVLDLIAEIRFVEPNAEFFISELTPAEQADWILDLVERTTVGDADAPHVCILDTGVNNGHPLLEQALHAHDMHTYHPDWPKHDADRHGSEMAGIALYGDLSSALNSQEQVALPHRLESVKILPPEGANSPKLWGAVTIDSVGRVEVENAKRTRVFAMMTTSVGHVEGNPSEWSATIDQLAFGRAPVDIPTLKAHLKAKSKIEETPRVPRLFVLSAGNVEWPEWAEYPEKNAQSPVQNPAQSWNALTVGACTHLVDIDTKKHPGYKAIAARGHLSPASTTSMIWSGTAWPFKPDVVAEGGNGSLDALGMVDTGPESLRVLTTSNRPLEEPFAASGDTSAAAAEVSRICAHLRAQYPGYWPETIRALVVHGAEYTPAMRATLSAKPKKEDKEQLLRTFGYGMVSLEQSEFSTIHRPTLVIQGEFNPYVRGDKSITLGDMQLHDLPWPEEELRALGATQVEMRVTLSYFVEPNPSSRGWQSKFRYQSHALRFAVKAATEDASEFRKRINKVERMEGEAGFTDPDSAQWLYGLQLRSRGSLHSDVWTGTAAQLASKSHVAVFAVGGWWKDWEQLKQWKHKTRYGLVISLRVADTVDTDIYTPIANIIQQGIAIDIDVPGGSQN
ncbi:S8 family peptidase [Burkholderia pseudomallei]|uniref:S8 family peptidase n=1 Tax=Burkholderia pseudomallei TaxID=28450 RepID=UPI001AD66978|nr:S8 family peptidase [Burkholderia pseudomallei]MBO7752274.1 S8 family peptidase [Burkholderia pseudomallei]